MKQSIAAVCSRFFKCLFWACAIVYMVDVVSHILPLVHDQVLRNRVIVMAAFAILPCMTTMVSIAKNAVQLSGATAMLAKINILLYLLGVAPAIVVLFGRHYPVVMDFAAVAIFGFFIHEKYQERQARNASQDEWAANDTLGQHTHDRSAVFASGQQLAAFSQTQAVLDTVNPQRLQ